MAKNEWVDEGAASDWVDETQSLATPPPVNTNPQPPKAEQFNVIESGGAPGLNSKIIQSENPDVAAATPKGQADPNANNPNVGDPLARQILTTVVAGGAGKAAGALGKLIAPTSQVLPKAMAGAAGGAVLGEKHPIAGAVLGGAAGTASGLMDFAGKQAAATLYRKFARAGQGGEAGELLKNGTAEVNDVIKRHGLDQLKEPLAANDAVKLKIADITKNDKALEEATAGAMVTKNKKLLEQIHGLRADAQKDLRVLNALQPITQRLATAHMVKLTAWEQSKQMAKAAAKRVLPYAAAGYAGHELLK